MKKGWEYKIEFFVHNEGSNDGSRKKEEDVYKEKFERSLNQLGKDGWELVDSHYFQTIRSREFACVFKKEVNIQ